MKKKMHALSTLLQICFFTFVSSLAHFVMIFLCQRSICICENIAVIVLSAILALSGALFVVFCKTYVARWHKDDKQTKRSLGKVLTYKQLFCLLTISWACVLPIFMKYAPHSFSRSYMVAALLFCVAFALAVYELLFSLTFRSVPTMFLTLSMCIYYVVFLSFTTSPKELWGLRTGSSAVYSFLAEGSFSNLLGWSVMGSAVATFIAEAGKSVWYTFGGSTVDGSSRVSYRFKLHRLRLISHRHHQNMLWWILTACVLLCVLASYILFLGKKEGVALDAISNLVFISGGISLLGISLHYFISDTGLIQAERKYISYNAATQWPRLCSSNSNKCKKSSPSWSDYCQVCANLYCSYSGISSEDYGKHDQFEVLKKISKDPSSECCPVRILADIVHSRDRQLFLFFCGISQTEEETLSSDLMFSHQVDSFWNDIANKSDNNLVIFTIKTAMLCLFSANTEQLWQKTFSAEQTTYKELEKLVLLEIVRFLSQQQGDYRECCLEWLCKARMGPEALLLAGPYIVKSIIKKRWPNKDFGATTDGNSFFCKLAEIYYYNLYDKKLNKYDVMSASGIACLDEGLVLFSGHVNDIHNEENLLRRMFFPQCIVDSQNPRIVQSVWDNVTASPRLSNAYLCSPKEREDLYRFKPKSTPLSSGVFFKSPFWYITRIIFAKNSEISLGENNNDTSSTNS